MAGLADIRSYATGMKNFLTPGTDQNGQPVSSERDPLFGVDAINTAPAVASPSFAQSMARNYQDAPTAASTMGIKPQMQAPPSAVQNPDIFLRGAPSPAPAQSPTFGVGIRDVKRL